MDIEQPYHVCAHCLAPRVTSKCSRCKNTWYCSRDCQMQDWKEGHKFRCRPGGYENTLPLGSDLTFSEEREEAWKMLERISTENEHRPEIRSDADLYYEETLRQIQREKEDKKKRDAAWKFAEKTRAEAKQVNCKREKDFDDVHVMVQSGNRASAGKRQAQETQDDTLYRSGVPEKRFESTGGQGPVLDEKAGKTVKTAILNDRFEEIHDDLVKQEESIVDKDGSRQEALFEQLENFVKEQVAKAEADNATSESAPTASVSSQSTSSTATSSSSSSSTFSQQANTEEKSKSHRKDDGKPKGFKRIPLENDPLFSNDLVSDDEEHDFKAFFQRVAKAGSPEEIKTAETTKAAEIASVPSKKKVKHSKRFTKETLEKTLPKDEECPTRNPKVETALSKKKPTQLKYFPPSENEEKKAAQKRKVDAEADGKESANGMSKTKKFNPSDMMSKIEDAKPTDQDFSPTALLNDVGKFSDSDNCTSCSSEYSPGGDLLPFSAPTSSDEEESPKEMQID